MFANKNSGPYSRPLNVKVIARDEAMDAELLNWCAMILLSLADCQSGTVMVLEDIRKTEDTQPTIIVTNAYKIFLHDLEVIKLEFILKLPISAMIGCLRTRVRKQPIISLYLEFETFLNSPPAETQPI